MADGIVIRMNLPDFRRQLAELGKRFEKNLVRRAVRAAGAVFRDEAKRQAPVLKSKRADRIAGALRRSIFVGASRGRPGLVKAFVGVKAARTTKKGTIDPFYWRFLEGGWIPRGPGKRFRGGNRTKALGRSRALKGGAVKSERPFLAPAFRAAQGRALDAFNQTMAEGIAEENSKRP